MSSKEKVLVIGDDTRSFLATVRSLGRHGIEVHAAPFNFSSSSLGSRYIQKIHFLPYYLDGGGAWLAAITGLLEKEKFDLVIPCDERGLLPLFRHREQLAPLARLAIPGPEDLDFFFDKLRTRELATKLAVPVAKGRVLSSSDTVQDILNDIGLPLIAKYRKSFSWPELYVRTSTLVIHTADELDNWLGQHRQSHEDIFFEQIFSGKGAGLSVLCSTGKILQAFEHHRVRELNGSSYYRKSVQVHEARLQAVASMVAHLGYTGIAMFEFKINGSSGDWILLEVNARPWGSLPLPVALGIDFPYRLYQLLAKAEETPSVSYPSDVYGRNLVSDLWQIRAVIQSWKRRPIKLFLYLAAWGLEFRRLPLGREHHDVGVKDDRLPGIAEFRHFLSDSVESIRTKVLGKPALKTGLRQKIIKESRKNVSPIRILFVCEGNICRSPYAERKLRQLLGEAGAGYVISSSGMLPRNRRPSPQVAIDAAARRGVVLSDHLSRHASEEDVVRASLIIIFDRTNFKKFSARYPAMEDKVFYLGEMGPAARKIQEIADPVGKDGSTFDQVYQQIDDGLIDLAVAIQERVNSEVLSCS